MTIRAVKCFLITCDGEAVLEGERPLGGCLGSVLGRTKDQAKREAEGMLWTVTDDGMAVCFHCGRHVRMRRASDEQKAERSKPLLEQELDL